jgi:uncharacterized protein
VNPLNCRNCTAFDGHRLIASGALADVARAAKQAWDAGMAGPLLVFDDDSGHTLEIDFRGSVDAVLARLQPIAADTVPRGPGRPKLGVVSREVTLLPRHWDWLNGQPGGASATLRRLVELARRDGGGAQRARNATETVERCMRTMAGDLAGYEEASRAFYRHDRERFAALSAAWPPDVRRYLQRLAMTAWDATTDD